jgi:osmotically-inducible protein OsmY
MIERQRTMQNQGQSLQGSTAPPTVSHRQLAQEVARAIAATGRFRQDQLDVSASDGVITLRGRVASYYQKQVAQTAALSIAGPGRLRNELEVA